MNIKIAIAYHKPSLILKQKTFLPIQVGKALANFDMYIQGDDTGDNISRKNPWYCELTALYWLWKNTSADYKGLMHYRRIFTYRKSFFLYKILLRIKYKERQFASLWSPYRSMGVKKQYNCQSEQEFKRYADYLSSRIESLLSDGTNIIAPHPGHFYTSIRLFMYQHVDKQIIDLLDNIIQRTFPEFHPYFQESLEQQWLYNCNMSIMDEETFNEYCNILFTTLKKHEEEIINKRIIKDIESEKVFSRVSGYLGEILTNAYINYSKSKGKKIKVLPVAYLESIDSNTPTSHNTWIKIYNIYFRGIHKNLHFPYLIHGQAMLAMPNFLYRLTLKNKISKFNTLSEEEQNYIKYRVDYYCRLNDGACVSDIINPKPNLLRHYKAIRIKDFKFKNKVGNTSYFLDTYEYIRFFPKDFKFLMMPGDISYHLPSPAIVKSRPISEDSTCNEVILNLDKLRHFLWISDPIKTENKQCRILFRGDIRQKPRREEFIHLWKGHPLCNLEGSNEMSIYEHLSYKYIMCLEGHDVASNLKWVMSSNSIAVMPRPTCETWFMEGQLKPNYHYIEIASDYHDLIDKINYYEAHPEEVKAIVKHAHEWVCQFQNKNREDLISLMVLDKYFQKTGQK